MYSHMRHVLGDMLWFGCSFLMGPMRTQKDELDALRELQEWCKTHHAVIVEDGGQIRIVIGSSQYTATMIASDASVWHLDRVTTERVLL